MTTNQTIDGVPRWVDKFGAEYRLCPVVGNLQIQVRDAGRPDKWVDVSMTPAHALTNLSPLHAAQPQGEPVAIKEAYEEGFSDGSRAGDDQCNWQGFRDEPAKCWPASEAYKLYAEQPAPVAIVGAKSEGFGQGLSIQDWFVKGYEHPDADKTKCERALFESFCHDGNRLGTSQNHRTDGSYDEIDTQAAWEAWQVRAKMEKQVAVVMPERKCDRKLGQALMENYRSG